MVGLTLDTGALIALEAVERGKTGNHTAVRLAKMLATRDDVRAHTPSVVVGEWWRGQRGKVAQLLTRFRIEIQSIELEDAQSAGLILASVDGSDERRRGMLVDALVLVTAVTRGDVMYTSDIEKRSPPWGTHRSPAGGSDGRSGPESVNHAVGWAIKGRWAGRLHRTPVARRGTVSVGAARAWARA